MSAVAIDPALRADLGDVLPDEFAQLKSPALLRNFEVFRRYNSASTELRWVRVSRGGQLAALVPVVRLAKRRVTNVLRPELRRWLGPTLGPFAKKTTMLVDTAFFAFDDRSPFHTVDGVDRAALKPLVSDLLKSERGVDSVWFTEPEYESAWAADEGYDQFFVLPMAQIETEGFADFDAYLASLSKKRRRNYRHERATFESASAEFEVHADGLSDSLIEELLTCLRASAEHSEMHVPYNDVLTDDRAFAEQDQLVLAARVDGSLVGFMSFLSGRQATVAVSRRTRLRPVARRVGLSQSHLPRC